MTCFCGQLAVKEIVAVSPDGGSRHTPLCWDHYREWRVWRDRIYGSKFAEPRVIENG